jgi:PST family polysaccharide transporter
MVNCVTSWIKGPAMSSQSSTLWQKTMRGTAWFYFSTYAGKVMVFISTVLLARLLLQEDFGVAGYGLVVISFLNVLSDLGIGTAFIYQADEDGMADTAFWLNLASGLLLFGCTWLAAPLAGTFFQDPQAIPIVRALAFTFPLAALGNIHDAMLRKSLTFRRKFIPDLTKAVSKGLISILLAFFGFGAWSLIWGHLAGTLAGTVILWWVVTWRPTWRLNRRLARDLVRYGGGIVGVNVLGVILLNLDYLLVGRYLGATALGIYTLAFRLPELLIQGFPIIVGNVLFPTFTKLRDDQTQLTSGIYNTLRYSAIVTLPIGVGLALVAGPLVLTLYSARWSAMIPVLTAVALSMTTLSLTFNLGLVYKAQGRPGILSRLALLRAVVMLPAIWWAVTGPATITAVAWTHTAVALYVVALDLLAARKLLGLSLRAIGAAFQPAISSTLLMAGAVLLLQSQLVARPALVQLVAAILLGGVVYGATLWWLQRAVVLRINTQLRAAFGSQGVS